MRYALFSDWTLDDPGWSSKWSPRRTMKIKKLQFKHVSYLLHAVNHHERYLSPGTRMGAADNSCDSAPFFRGGHGIILSQLGHGLLKNWLYLMRDQTRIHCFIELLVAGNFAISCFPICSTLRSTPDTLDPRIGHRKLFNGSSGVRTLLG